MGQSGGNGALAVGAGHMDQSIPIMGIAQAPQKTLDGTKPQLDSEPAQAVHFLQAVLVAVHFVHGKIESPAETSLEPGFSTVGVTLSAIFCFYIGINL